jgi:hypothetical protein
MNIISLRFLGIIWRVLRLEVSPHNVYKTNQFQTTFAQEETVKSKEETSEDFYPNYVQEFVLCMHLLQLANDYWGP